MGEFCRWYDKSMENLAEHEQEQCERNGCCCSECPDLVITGEEKEYLEGQHGI